jgi:hypothetical protein
MFSLNLNAYSVRMVFLIFSGQILYNSTDFPTPSPIEIYEVSENKNVFVSNRPERVYRPMGGGPRGALFFKKMRKNCNKSVYRSNPPSAWRLHDVEPKLLNALPPASLEYSKLRIVPDHPHAFFPPCARWPVDAGSCMPQAGLPGPGGGWSEAKPLMSCDSDIWASFRVAERCTSDESESAAPGGQTRNITVRMSESWGR